MKRMKKKVSFFENSQKKKMRPFFDPNKTPKNKKYSVITPQGKLIHFGDRNMQTLSR